MDRNGVRAAFHICLCCIPNFLHAYIHHMYEYIYTYVCNYTYMLNFNISINHGYTFARNASLSCIVKASSFWVNVAMQLFPAFVAGSSRSEDM